MKWPVIKVAPGATKRHTVGFIDDYDLIFQVDIECVSRILLQQEIVRQGDELVVSTTLRNNCPLWLDGTADRHIHSPVLA
jgi:hypothetical protein